MPGFGLDLKLRQQRGGFDPALLFASGAAGALYEVGPGNVFQDAGGTLAANVGDPVGRLADRSGNGNHAVQTIAAARPVLRQEAGAHYLDFDGVDDRLRAQFAIPQPFDRVSALRIVDYTFDRQILGGGTANAGVLWQNAAAPSIAIFSGASAAATDAAVGVNVTISERHHGAASRLGVNDALPAIGNCGSASSGGITIGSYYEGTLASRMRLYALLMIGRSLSDGETAQLRRHLGARAGL